MKLFGLILFILAVVWVGKSTLPNWVYTTIVTSIVLAGVFHLY